MYSQETLHLAKKKKWYKGKKPKLQIDILSCLALEGPISKGQAEKVLKKSHSDIIVSFEKLIKINFIETNEKKNGRGRPQCVYKITDKGVQALFNEFINPLNFWKILYGYFANYGDTINSDDIEKYFDKFFEKHLKYHNKQCIDQIDTFVNMSEKWINNFVKSKDIVTAEQIILETLSLYPKISFNELVKKSKLNFLAVSEVLHTHTMECYPDINNPQKKIAPNVHPDFIGFFLDERENFAGKKDNPLYWDFMQHNIINVTNNSKGEKIYELSLFGVILVLKLIRFLYGTKKEINLYFCDISFIEYFEKIVNNYDAKLPLIFGKWNFLKSILKDYAISNFNKIINGHYFQQDAGSISRGGNHEFFYGIREIILQTRQQLVDFADAGKECFGSFLGNTSSETYNNKITFPSSYLDTHYPKLDKTDIKKIEKITFLLNKCLDIINILNPVEQMLTNPELSYAKNSARRNNLIKEFENSFANIVTAFYYFNLHIEHNFFNTIRTRTYRKDPDLPLPLSRKECLDKILTNEDISNFFQVWYDDITNLQKSINEHL